MSFGTTTLLTTFSTSYIPAGPGSFFTEYIITSILQSLLVGSATEPTVFFFSPESDSPTAAISISSRTTSTPLVVTANTNSVQPISPSTDSTISYSSITSTSITSTPITTISTVPSVHKLSKGAKSGIGLGVIGFIFLVVIAIVWYRQFHHKRAGYDSRTSEGLEASFSQPEVAERSHELDGEEVLELDGSMLHSPVEMDGAEAATASSQTNVQTSIIGSKSDQESQHLPEAIHRNGAAQTRNSAERQASPGKETQLQAKVDELNRLEEEERRIDEMIADAERLERLRKERLAIQDRIKQAKAESIDRE